jgi:hypothetical protein
MARSVPTVPIASASGGESDFKITKQNWQKIERAYRNTLSADVRDRILKATTAFCGACVCRLLLMFLHGRAILGREVH